MSILYHYCSNEAFISIISKHIIWASEFTLSNDLLEGKWIRSIVEECCDDKGLSPLQKSFVLKNLDNLISFIGGAGICLSQEGDLLSQWRAYSQNGSGVSIGFKQSSFGVEASSLPNLQQVIYDPPEQKQQIDPEMERIAELVRNGAGRPRPTLMTPETEDEGREREMLNHQLWAATFALFPHLYLLKNPAFKEEKEWRSVTVVIPNSPGSTPASEGPGWFLAEMDFRALPDRIVPYKEFPLDTRLPVICEIILGPRNVTPARVVEAALLRHGWTGVRVRKSDASYR